MDYIVDLVVLSIFLAIVCAYVLYYYVQLNWRKLELWALFCVWFSMWICVIPFGILILDVDVATHEHVHVMWLIPLWRGVFWVTQFCSIILLPLIQEYSHSGELTPWRRIKHSAKLNLKLYTFLAIIGSVLLGYIIFAKGLHSFNEVQALVMAAVNAFGLSLITIFLAYGMAAIPRRLWRSGDIHSKLAFLYWQVPSLHDTLELCEADWCELSQEVKFLVVHVPESDEYAPFIQQLNRFVEDVEMSSMLKRSGTSARTKYVDMHKREKMYDSIVTLSSNLKRTANDLNRLTHKWLSMREKCQVWENRKRTVHRAALEGIMLHNLSRSSMKFFLQYIFWKYIRTIFIRSLSVLFGLFGLLIAWSEFSLPFNWSQLGGVDLSVVSLVSDSSTGGIRITGCVLILGFMASTTYWSVFQFHFFHMYELTPHYSHIASLCFTATFLTRLILPLCYNFLNIAHFVNSSKSRELAFSTVLGDMNVVDFLGVWFNRFFPALVLFLYFCILFNISGHILSICGIATFDTKSLEDDEVVEGQEIVARSEVELELKGIYNGTK